MHQANPPILAYGKLRAPSDRTIGAYLFLLLLALVHTQLLARFFNEVPFWRLVFASLMLWVTAVPTFLFIRSPKGQIPFLPLIALLYFIYFGLPVFLDTMPKYRHHFDPESLTEAVGLALVGETLMLLGYYWVRWWRVLPRAPRIRIPINIHLLSWHALVVAAVGIFYSAWGLYGNVPSFLRATVTATRQLPLLLLGCLFLAYLRGRLDSVRAGAALVISLGYLLIELGKGRLAGVMLLVAATVFLYIRERAKVPWKSGLLAIMLTLPFMHSKHDFRRELDMGSGTAAEAPALERITTFLEITKRQIEGDEEFVEQVADTVGQRTNYLGTFAHVIKQTPARVPYWYGATYSVLLWAFIPRAVVHDKPSMSLGQEFGHRYNLLDYHDHHTSLNCPQLIEMYCNFGLLGLIGGMLLVGMFYGVLDHFLNRKDCGDGVIVTGAMVLAHELNIESGATVLVGAVHLSIVCLAAMWALSHFTARLKVHGKPEVL